MRVCLLMAVASATLCQAEIGVAQDVVPDAQAPLLAAQDSALASPTSREQMLQQALARTDQTSSTLLAQLAELRGLDSGGALARAAGHPQIATSASFDEELIRACLSTTAGAPTFCQTEVGVAQDVVPDTQAAPSNTQAPALAAPDPRFASPVPPVQTLQQALARTYQTSPTLMAQRAELRGLDSGVALARAAGHPQIATGVNFSQEVYTTRQVGTRGRSLSATADVEQVLFAGGRIRNSVRAADTRVIAGRADLRATEGDVFTEAVGAYADLIRDREIRNFNLDQVRVLEANLDSTRSRRRVGDLTKADVSQSEARLAVARSNLATAEGRLQSSEENFERVVGARAGMLEPLPPLPPMPATADEAVETALADNADVASFVARARAAGYEVAATRAERLPTISAVSSTAYSNALGTADEAVGLPKGTLPNSATNIGAGLSLRLPLYQGGAASARVRLAEEARAQLMEQAIAAERLTVASARADFATWRSALTAITANESAVASNEEALESVKIEQTVGARSILDVLNAEQELLSSRIALASARRDAYVAAFALLNTMGAAEAANLNLEVGPLYDPRANYRTYAHTLSDWADGRRRTPASTRTVPEQVNSPLSRLETGRPDESEKRP
jgi:outer membrane protein